MNTQAKTNRMANELDDGHISIMLVQKSAAEELRRLHEVNQELLIALGTIRNSCYMPIGIILFIDEVIAKAQKGKE